MEPEFSFRISDSKSRIIRTWFLVFLPALYFTTKGVEAILKVTSFWLIIKELLLLYCSDSKFNYYYSYSKDKPSFSPLHCQFA